MNAFVLAWHEYYSRKFTDHLWSFMFKSSSSGGRKSEATCLLRPLRSLRAIKKTLGISRPARRSNLSFREISEICVRKELIRAHSCPSWDRKSFAFGGFNSEIIIHNSSTSVSSVKSVDQEKVAKNSVCSPLDSSNNSQNPIANS